MLSGGRRRATSLMAISAICYAFVPLAIELTGDTANPLLFNAIAIAWTVVVQLFFLRVTASSAFGTGHTISTVSAQLAGLSSASTGRGTRQTIKALFMIFTGPATMARIHDGDVSSVSRSKLAKVIRLPFLWAVVGWFQFGLYVWATRYVEVAIAAAVYELWLIMMVMFLMRQRRKDAERDAWHRNDLGQRAMRNIGLDRQKLLLMVAAFVGIALVILGQSDTSISSVRSFLGNRGIGVLLAFASAGAASALGIAGFLSGERLYAYYHEIDDVPEIMVQDSFAQEQALAHDQRFRFQQLWFIFLLMFTSALLAITPHLVFGILSHISLSSINPKILIGGLCLGLLTVAGSLFWRLANVVSSDLAINTITYITPVIGLGLLEVAGTSLARADLFWLGAMLVFAANALIHLSPEQETEYRQYRDAAAPRNRVGFTWLIIALWTFGAIIYTRDEVLSPRLLAWDASEYWALVALSATVFALILGFRVARLTSRISTEDEAMITLFRRSEYLVGRGALPPNILDELRVFDTTGPQNQHLGYEKVRSMLWETTSGTRDEAERDTTHDMVLEAELLELRTEFDKLAHSKQQGRDFAESLSICLIALITVVLGLFARPTDLTSALSGWGGFMTELFSTVFVSMVAFLCINLLDLRRDRQAPLLVEIPEVVGQFGLFFRYRQNVAVAQVVSVTIVAAIVTLFAILLYNKWL